MSLLSVPLKSIIAWNADIQNDTPPLEYAICDGRTLSASQQDISPGGTYTVPDLRNSFLIGADLTKTTGVSGAAVGSGNENLSAGAPGPKAVGGENSHSMTVAEMPAHSHSTNAVAHISLGSTTDTGATPGNSIGFPSATEGSTGGNGPHENRPKNYAVVYIMKVKN